MEKLAALVTKASLEILKCFTFDSHVENAMRHCDLVCVDEFFRLKSG